MKEEIRRLRYCRSGRVLDRGGDGHGRVEERNQCGLEGVVQVGLARPDRADHVVVLVELVEPGAALVVDDMFVDILGERGIPVGVHLLAGGRVQRGGSVQRFGQRPMHAIGDHGLAVPVGRVGESHGAVGVPCVGHGTREQVFGGVDVRLLRQGWQRSSTPTA